MSYQPAVNSVAWRAIAHLESLPKGAEIMTSALGEAIGVEGRNLMACMEPALTHGKVFRRQRDTHVRSPMWWSLTDHGARPKVDIRQPAVPVSNSATAGLVPAADGSQKPNADAAGWPGRAGSDQSGVAQLAARRAHNPEVGGSSPPPASITPASPRVGAMGAGQAADAGPVGAKRRVLIGLSAGVSMDGKVSIESECGTVILFNAQRAKQLLAFFAGRVA